MSLIEPKILYVDDEERSLKYASRLWSSEFRWDVHTASNGVEAKVALDSGSFDLVLSDVRMPVCGGFDLLAWVNSNYPRLPVILTSAYVDNATFAKAISLGAAGLITKPWSTEDLYLSVMTAMVRKSEAVRPRPPQGNEIAPALGDSLFVDIAAAFIHKLSSEFRNLTCLARQMRGEIEAIDPQRTSTIMATQSTLLDATNSIEYLLQRFRNVMGRHPGQLRNISINRVLLDVLKHLSHSPSRLTSSLDSEPCEVIGDYELLWHLFENLIRNGLESIGATANGEVSVTLKSSSDESQLLVEVQDNGNGIAPEALPRIFDLNYSTKAKGMGIGLYLARRAAQIHRGSLDCESQLGKGTTFTVTLPRAQQERQ
jgi:signal transduction histidine kinase